jgi:hypothetical protein
MGALDSAVRRKGQGVLHVPMIGTKQEHFNANLQAPIRAVKTGYSLAGVMGAIEDRRGR